MDGDDDDTATASYERATADLELIVAAYETEIQCETPVPEVFPLHFTLTLSDAAHVVLELVHGYPSETNVQIRSYRCSPSEKSAIQTVLEAIRISSEDCLREQVEGCFACCAAALDAWEENSGVINENETEDDIPEDQISSSTLSVGVNWIVGEPLIDRKSTFLAYACRVNSETEVNGALRQLIDGNSKLQRSTHNMVRH